MELKIVDGHCHIFPPLAGASGEAFVNDGTFLSQGYDYSVAVPFTNGPTSIVHVESNSLSFTVGGKAVKLTLVNGQATYTYTPTVTETDNIVAVYSGDGSFASSDAPSLTENVGSAVTTM